MYSLTGQSYAASGGESTLYEIKAFAIGAVGIDLRVLSQILDRGVTGVTTFGSGVDLCDNGACIEPEFRPAPLPQIKPTSDTKEPI